MVTESRSLGFLALLFIDFDRFSFAVSFTGLIKNISRSKMVSN